MILETFDIMHSYETLLSKVAPVTIQNLLFLPIRVSKLRLTFAEHSK